MSAPDDQPVTKCPDCGRPSRRNWSDVGENWCHVACRGDSYDFIDCLRLALANERARRVEPTTVTDHNPHGQRREAYLNGKPKPSTVCFFCGDPWPCKDAKLPSAPPEPSSGDPENKWLTKPRAPQSNDPRAEELRADATYYAYNFVARHWGKLTPTQRKMLRDDVTSIGWRYVDAAFEVLAPEAATERDKLVAGVAEAAMHVPIKCLKSESNASPEIAEVWKEAMDRLWGAVAQLAAFDARPFDGRTK